MPQEILSNYLEPWCNYNAGKTYKNGSWRRNVIERDNNTCRNCSNTVRDMFRKRPATNEAHHIIPRLYGGKNTLNNGITLCIFCHDYFHAAISSQGIEYIEILQDKDFEKRVSEVKNMLIRNYIRELSRGIK